MCVYVPCVGLGLDLYEGDIVLDKDDLETIDNSEEGDIDGKEIKEIVKRNAERQRRKLWHDRVVPYEIASELSKSITTFKFCNQTFLLRFTLNNAYGKF